jgi:hypothetical protein
MVETWRPVVGFEGRYEVSDLGRVRSLDRTRAIPTRLRSGETRTLIRHLKGRVLRPGRASHGYYTVNLDQEARCLHELVLLAFRGPKAPGQLARHLDGDKANNRLGNLVWGSPLENVQDTARHGRKTFGERFSSAKLTDAHIPFIRASRGKISQRELAEMFNVSPAAIQAVHDRRTWTHV